MAAAAAINLCGQASQLSGAYAQRMPVPLTCLFQFNVGYGVPSDMLAVCTTNHKDPSRALTLRRGTHPQWRNTL